MYYGKELSLFQKMIRRKPLTSKEIVDCQNFDNGGENDELSQDPEKLKRVLGVFDIISFGIAIAVGSGIFVIAGEAGKYSGAGLFLSFIVGAVSCLFCGLCYAEFSTRVPVSGSAYTYAYCSLGEIIGFLIGWDLTLEYGISAATIAQGLEVNNICIVMDVHMFINFYTLSRLVVLFAIIIGIIGCKG